MLLKRKYRQSSDGSNSSASNLSSASSVSLSTTNASSKSAPKAAGESSPRPAVSEPDLPSPSAQQVTQRGNYQEKALSDEKVDGRRPEPQRAQSEPPAGQWVKVT